MHTEEELVRRARQGDRHAFGLLVSKHEAAIGRTVTAMLGPGNEVDDVVQDTFIRCYESLHRFRSNAAFGTYLHRIAINRSRDVLRRRQRWRARFVSHDELTLPAEELTSEEEMIRKDRAKLVHAAIAQLSPDHRSVITLRLLQGFSTEETANMLGIRYGTVLSRLSRATRRLKDLLPGVLAEENSH